MVLLKKLFRILGYALLVVVAFAIGAVAVLTLTGKGRENLAGIISDLASTPDQKIALSGIDGIWSGNLRLDQLVIEDAKGPWLVVRGAEIDWSPLALLSKTFSADRIFAQRIEMARTPESKPAETETSGSFSLPVSLALRDIDLPEIALGPDIAGGVAELGAKGSAMVDASPMRIQTDLNIARKDGTEGSVQAKVTFAPDDNKLDVDVTGSEPAGGILANLLKLPGQPSVDVALKGSGPLADWAGEGSFSVDGNVITSLSGRHRLTEAGRAIEAQGKGDFMRFVPAQFQPLLAGQTAFDAAATLTPSGGVSIERANISSDGLEGTASGTVNPEGASDFKLEFNAKGNSVPLSLGSDESPLDIEIGSGSLRAFGAGNEPALDVSLTLPSVATNDTKVENIEVKFHSDAFNIENRTGPISGSATATRIGFDNPTIAPLIAGRIATEFSGSLSASSSDSPISDTVVIDSGSLRSDALQGAFDGRVSLADGSITLNVKADAASAALPAAARGVLGERTVISTSLNRDAQGNIAADSLELSSGQLSASGQAKLADGALDAEIQGALADVGLLAPDATGAIAFQASAKGALAAPDVALTVTSDTIEAAQREIRNLKLTASGKADLANPAADVALSGTVGGETLDGRAILKTTDGRREINGLTLSLGQNRIAGDLVLDDSFVPLGEVNFELPDIGPLAALALETAEGDVRGKINFTRNGETPEVKVTANTAKITRGELSVQNVAIDALVSNFMASPAISGTIKAATVNSGGTIVKNVDVALRQDGSWTGFNGGATVNDIPAKAAGRVQLADSTTTIELASAEATVKGIRAALARASTIRIKDGRTALEGLALNLGGGTATVSGTAGETLNLDVALSNLPVALANAFAPGLDAGGNLSGTVKVTGQASAPSVAYDANWSGAATSQTRAAGIGALGIVSKGTFASNRLSFNATASDASGLNITGGGAVQIAGTPQLDLRFTGRVPFGFLGRQLAAQGMALTGNADVNVTVSGPATAPVIGGTIQSSGARFVSAANGIAVNDLALDVAINNGVATIRRLTGTISSGGTITAGGTVGIDAAQGFPADITIRVVEGRYTDGRVVTVNFGADLKISGPLVSAPAISGAINLGKTIVTVPDRLPASLQALDVQHKNAPAAVRAQDRALNPAEATGSNGGGLSLDIAINAPQQIFVQGRGLDAELGGNLRLTGPVSSPEAVGQFTLRRGRLSILGKRLDFTEGTLGFSGSLVPYLDMTAESSATDATVTVLVTGPANNPKFSFQSIPVLPEDEVLARLIFGRSMSNLSPLQIAQLADAAAQLTGVGGSSSLLTTLRNQLGVDDLDVKTDETGAASVAAGKYLNDRTYITLEKGEKPGSGKATIDLNVGRGVKLRGQAADDGEAKGGIFYEREY
ncbi:translocation/assembly module TamB domain-containing protein [Mesorhizobium sp. SB112]|uniref:translocation/assembly module TamB domain-containing protein n=1 Tax=Mesorhizobium sp. SB112 TaxID=3151853 RepID=UPI00326510D5